MPYPTSGYTPTEVEARVTFNNPGWANAQTVRLVFPAIGHGQPAPYPYGISEPCFEQAITDAATAFADALSAEVTIESITYAYVGRIN